jgi:hypothetical protein
MLFKSDKITNTSHYFIGETLNTSVFTLTIKIEIFSIFVVDAIFIR